MQLHEKYRPKTQSNPIDYLAHPKYSHWPTAKKWWKYKDCVCRQEIRYGKKSPFRWKYVVWKIA